jgi:hypothetical protein
VLNGGVVDGPAAAGGGQGARFGRPHWRRTARRWRSVEEEELVDGNGPIQAFVIGVPDNDRLAGRIAEEARLSDIGQIRVIDAV